MTAPRRSERKPRIDMDRLAALVLLTCARYRLSDESRRYALYAAHGDPAKALACYEAIIRSIPRHQR